MIRYIPYSTNLCVDKFVFAEKDSFMFSAGASTSNLCLPGMMCRLDCPWLSPYLFVSLGGWPFGIQVQPDLAMIRAYCRDPRGSPQPGIIVSAPPELVYRV